MVLNKLFHLYVVGIIKFFCIAIQIEQISGKVHEIFKRCYSYLRKNLKCNRKI